MKDLYRQLGVDAASGEADLRAAAAGAATDVREAAEFILLDPSRRAVYDRNRAVLLTVGRLRGHLGLNLTRFWPRSRFADFTVDLNPIPRGGAGRRPIDASTMAWAFGVEPLDAGRPTRRTAVMVVALLIAAAAVTFIILAWRQTH